MSATHWTCENNEDKKMNNVSIKHQNCESTNARR